MGSAVQLRIRWRYGSYGVAYCSVLGLFPLLFAIEAGLHGSIIGVAAALLVLGLLGATAWRCRLVTVVGDENGLLIRNFGWTQRLQLDEIAGFRSGGSGWEWPGRAVRVLRKDGSTVVLVATGRYSSSERHEGQLAQLERWLRAPARRG